MLEGENDMRCQIVVFQSDEKYFVKYNFENTAHNKHIEMFEPAAKTYYFEIDAQHWEKIKNAASVERTQN